MSGRGGSRRERGAALLLALVVTAIAGVMAGTMLFQSELQISRTTQLSQQARSWQLAAGMEEWALSILDRDHDITPFWDAHDDLWAQPLPPTQVPGGEVSGSLVDLSGRFNLNSLLRPDGVENTLAIARFTRLVDDVLELDPAIRDQLLDHMRNGPRFLQHETELRGLPAVTDQAWQKIRPLIAALPPLAPLNVNTAPAPVLMALADGVSLRVAERLAPGAGNAWQSVADFRAHPALSEISLDTDGLAVTSAAFRAHTRIVIDDTPLNFYSVIFRGGTRPDSSYHVRNRSMMLP